MKRFGCLLLLGVSLFEVGCTSETATTNPVNVPVNAPTDAEKPKANAKDTAAPAPADTKAL